MVPLGNVPVEFKNDDGTRQEVYPKASAKPKSREHAQMIKTCEDCGAIKFADEIKLTSMCCHKGKVRSL